MRTEFFEINNIQVQQNSEKLKTLNKINAETTEKVQYLVTEVNYLKLWLKNPHSTSESKFCTYCKKKSYYVGQCWKKNGNRHNQTDNSEDKITFQNYNNSSEDKNFQTPRPNYQNDNGEYKTFEIMQKDIKLSTTRILSCPVQTRAPPIGVIGVIIIILFVIPTIRHNTLHVTMHSKGNNQHKKKYRSDQFARKNSRQTHNNEHRNRTGPNGTKQQHKNITTKPVEK